MTVRRQHPRFVTSQRVELQAGNRNALRALWMADISKGGLFVETDDPPPLRQPVSVTLSTEDGELTLSAEVVHILDTAAAAGGGGKPGVGLQFVDLDAQTRRRIEAYVEGLSEALDVAATAPAARTGADSHAVLEVIKRVLQGFEQEDLYGAIGVPPLASNEEIEVRLRKIGRLLEGSTETLTAAQASRAAHVRGLVRRLGALLLHPDRRLDYDLRHGHLFPRERLAIADDTERERLRRVWHRNQPQALALAEKHVSLAVRYEGVMKYKEAVEAANEALKHDPFNHELWKALDTWQERLNLAEQRIEDAGSE